MDKHKKQTFCDIKKLFHGYTGLFWLQLKQKAV